MIGVKQKWFQLIAMVAGLASSIEGSSILTTTADTLADTFGICDKHSSTCHHPWLFVLLQFILATIITVVFIPALALLVETRKFSKDDPTPSELSSTSLEHSTPREDQPLLPEFQ